MKQIVHTDKAPKPAGAYSQAVVHHNLIYVSGMVPLDPATGEFALGAIEAETKLAMSNLQAVLEAAGSKMDSILKATVYLADIKDYAAFDQVYRSFFTESFPARAVIQAAALPKGCKIEIEAVAAPRDEVTY